MAEYPARITGADIMAVLDGEHYNITSPFSAKDFVRSLPGATWDPRGRVWQVKKRWHGKLGAALAAYAEDRNHQVEAAAEAKRQRADAAAQAAAAGLRAIREMKPYASGIRIGIERDGLCMHTAYHPEIVALFKALGGRYQATTRYWVLPCAAGSAIAERRDQIAAWHNETVQADQEKSAAKEAERAARERTRKVVPYAHRPAIGAMIDIGGARRVVESFGKPFRIDEDMPSAGHPHLLGHEGELACYAYTRAATVDEVAAAELKAAEDRKAAEARRDRAAIVAKCRRQIEAHGEHPDGWHEPEGEMLGRGPDIYGTGAWFVVGPEWIWLVVNNGMDGDDWSRNNIRTGGAGAIGRRVPYDPELAAAIRQGMAK